MGRPMIPRPMNPMGPCIASVSSQSLAGDLEAGQPRPARGRGERVDYRSGGSRVKGRSPPAPTTTNGTAAARSGLTWAPCGSRSITSPPGGPTGSRSTPGPSSGWRGTAGATRCRRRSGTRRARWRSAGRASWPSPSPGSGCSASPRSTRPGSPSPEGRPSPATRSARHLAGARRAVAFVLTLGPVLETEVIALGERQELLEAYLLDLAGWAGIEAAVRALRRDLIAALPRARVSHRLGRGHPARLAAHRAARPRDALRGRRRARAAL